MAEPQSDPEQIVMMKRLVELAEKQTELAVERTRMSTEQSRMSEDRSRMSADRSRMSAERSEMSADRSKMSADRSEMSEARTYLNAERTLSVWVRTALSLMILGLAVDRFGLFLAQTPGTPSRTALPFGRPFLDALSTWAGLSLVALGVVMVVTTGSRFLAYARTWRKQHELPAYHGPYLATFFALMVALFGLLLLVPLVIFVT